MPNELDVSSIAKQLSSFGTSEQARNRVNRYPEGGTSAFQIVQGSFYKALLNAKQYAESSNEPEDIKRKEFGRLLGAFVRDLRHIPGMENFQAVELGNNIYLDAKGILDTDEIKMLHRDLTLSRKLLEKLLNQDR
jgi:hypothetical protein